MNSYKVQIVINGKMKSHIFHNDFTFDGPIFNVLQYISQHGTVKGKKVKFDDGNLIFYDLPLSKSQWKQVLPSSNEFLIEFLGGWASLEIFLGEQLALHKVCVITSWIAKKI
jgi:hypothetical protein